MDTIHPPGPIGPTTYACAQAGCRDCLEHLLRHHEPLIHIMVQRQCRWGIDYVDLVQEGRIALWRAICRYDPRRGSAFSTYACTAIQRQLWDVIERAHRERPWRGWALPVPEMPDAWRDPAEHVEAASLQSATREALNAACRRLPERLRAAIYALGLDGHPAQTLDAVGAAWGYTGERVRQWRQDALVLLRLPAYSSALREIGGFNTRPSYQRTQALSRAWLRRVHPDPHRARSCPARTRTTPGDAA
jgi:RNA polymerase sigma factor (sigma-70 family)